MYRISTLAIFLLTISCHVKSQSEIASPTNYLNDIKKELSIEWPENKTINLVFHGHSVPAGYFKTPVVNTFEAYPFQLLKLLKSKYPHAVVNVINTSIGGENSEEGAARFEEEVLNHRPDVLFIDYALNDRRIGLEKANGAWKEMITKAIELDIKILLLTPTPDQRVDLLEANNKLEQHTNQIVQMAKEHNIGLIDSYTIFKQRLLDGDNISDFMSQVNHPNKAGHELVAKEILKYFE